MLGSWHAVLGTEHRVEDAVAGTQPADVGRRVRRRRRAARLSQDELAARAGVSRQAIGALEAGRHLPRVDAAVAIARVLETSVEDLLAVGPPRALHVLGGEVEDGTPVRAARVGDHTVVVGIEGERGFAAPDGVVRDRRLHPFVDAELDRFVVVGCDPALGLLDELAPGQLLVVTASPGAARLALATGRAHAAVVHDQEPPPSPRDPARIRRLPLASWRVGLASRPEDESSLEDALAGRLPVLPADAGDAAQAAYERVTGQAAMVHTTPSRSHLDAARRAARDGGVVVTTEPAALAHGLAFHALETHLVEMWIDDGASGHPGARLVSELLGASSFLERVAAVPGYLPVADGAPSS